MSKLYTFSHVLFALREEYQKTEKQLEELKKYVNASNRVEYFHFYIAGYPCKMFLCLHKKKNLLEKIEEWLGPYIAGLGCYDITKVIESAYYYNKKELCYINEREELRKKINQIIEGDFFQNIVANDYVSIPCVENKINTLFIRPSNIGLINGVNGTYPHFDYYSHDDKLIMKNEDKIITPDDIFELLSLSLDENYLNDYHRSILDNYEEKEIDIEDSFDSTTATLKIVEEPKRLVLRPVK